jgi:hypothetical protein
MSKQLSLLCVHGVGHAEGDPDFRAAWTKAISAAIQTADPDIKLRIDFLEYDKLFERAPLNTVTYSVALGKLLLSATIHGLGDIFSRSRGFKDIPDAIQWTAGMVAQWSTDDGLRKELRNGLLAKMQANTYDVVLAHSLGSLICYDTFVQNQAAIKDRVFVTLGSQIGNPAVRDVFAGRIQGLPCRKWYHLFNPADNVLTYPIKNADLNFTQVDEPFDIPNDILNHDATWYLSDVNAAATLWRDLAGKSAPMREFTATAAGLASRKRDPDRRALLIGINNYPDPENVLEGCVNDVFLMSSVLQESGFNPEEIRVVLDERATTQAIMDRLHWLLDDVRDDDQRVLFYSGHGAQIPGYGANGEPDHVDECLVPYDFDWTPERAIADKKFCEMYSQLPYDSYFVAMFDCCHSGGITRAGGPRVRGLNPPDDIRHRALRWEPGERMWVDRNFRPLNKSLAKTQDRVDYLGDNGATRRLGRAITLRSMPDKKYDKVRKDLGHLGPYMPILLEACGEQEFSYEYKDGATSYGAYTYCMAQVLRENRLRGVNLGFEELSRRVTAKLHRLKYDQTPELVGAKVRTSQLIPWAEAARQASGGRTSARRAAPKRAKAAKKAGRKAAKK